MKKSKKVKKVTKSARIRELLAQGKSQAEIVKSLKVSPQLVYAVAKQKPKLKSKARFNSPRSRLINDLFQMKKAMDEVDAEKKLEQDLVNHPPHYKAGGIETIDFIEAKDLNYRLGNVVKYVSRAGRKPGSDPVKDLEKALWYLQREINVRKKA